METLYHCPSSNVCRPLHNSSVSPNSTGGNTTAAAAAAAASLYTEADLLDILGPKRSPFFLPVAAVYLLIFLVGLSGNLLTCAVVAKHKKMRNTTNLYLVSLAVSDLLMLAFGMPMEIYDLWQNYPFPFGAGGCYFKTFIFETVCFASILNVTALSVERYIAVMHPLKTRYITTKRHTKRVIGAVWAVSMVCAVPNMSLHGIFYLQGRMRESAICTVLQPVWMYHMLMQITTVCFFFVPMMVIGVLYLVMGLHLGRETRQRRVTLGKNWGSDEGGRRTQVIKMLSIVVAVFGVCWAPFHTERLLWSSVGQWTDLMHNIYQYVHILSGVLFYLSSAVNPVIYSLISTRFRECFSDLVCSRVDEPDSPPPPKISLVLSASGVQTGGQDSLIRLLSPPTTQDVDAALLSSACDDTASKISVF
ncbi:neuromedin-U receptor 1 isoform X1 [Phyllopteryx taeniolatus]|uniref:neuromedin-U receptor 1 isoform X1 n=1 Tax=Phyllopteryx taeniolatus TaxID=161469 RepID=UPI002AD55092|nr:neuromedin-U receptor 1 isoform X1 [Phyllopteryx taeniolatus]XP_061641843.1 neuromedin-U receptor 1 isoform X1 [Phyllopteryx taeniolatus]